MNKDYLQDIIDDEIDTLYDSDYVQTTINKKNTIDGLSKEEKKKLFIGIMSKYNSGKEIAELFVATIREVTTAGKEKKLPNIILRKEIVAEEHQEVYENAVREYNRGMQMTLEAKEEMLMHLENFIYYIIEKRFPTFKVHTKDLYQEGVIGILKGFDSYDATVSLPTTYFFIYIVHEMTEFINININKTTPHYSASIVKVKKAINHFEREGREWSITDIAQETGISAETILQSVRIMELSKEKHYETVDYLDSQMSQNVASPESEYIKNEANEILFNAVSSLPEDEALIIALKYSERLSYKNIAEKTRIPIDKVKKKHNAAIRKLRKSKIIHGNFNLIKEDKALNSLELGVVPINVAESIMEQLLAEDV